MSSGSASDPRKRPPAPQVASSDDELSGCPRTGSVGRGRDRHRRESRHRQGCAIELALAGAMSGIDAEITESTRFSGRAIVALATDPDVSDCTGLAFTTRDPADRFGFTDVDGRLPPHQPWTPPR
jgi:hypothetical protein